MSPLVSPSPHSWPTTSLLVTGPGIPTSSCISQDTFASDADKVAALEAVLSLLPEQDLVLEAGTVNKEEVESRLCEVRTRLLLAGAGLGQRWQTADDVSVITTLYTELPLQENSPGRAY